MLFWKVISCTNCIYFVGSCTSLVQVVTKAGHSSQQYCPLLIANSYGMLHLLYMFNSFVLLTFDKTVILEVSRTGTINLALRPDVYCIIFQLLEVLPRLKVCFFYAMDAWPPKCRFWNRGSIYIRNYSGKNEFESDFGALWYASFSVTCKVTKMWVT